MAAKEMNECWDSMPEVLQRRHIDDCLELHKKHIIHRSGKLVVMKWMVHCDVIDEEKKTIIVFDTVQEALEHCADQRAIDFSEWLIKACDYETHGVWSRYGDEYTQEELLKIYKNEMK